MSEIKRLLERYLDESITEAEFRELWASLEYAPKDEQWHAFIEELLENENIRGLSDKAGAEAALVRIKATLGSKASRRVFPLRRWLAAAAVLLLLAAGAYLWVAREKNSVVTVAAADPPEVQPGKEGAILTLADGSQILLDSIKNAVVALQGGATAKVVNGVLLYEAGGNKVVYNTITTPKGRRYHAVLPDGTEVWLNAASAIRYPTAFTGKERKVEINGEAYFEVVKNEEKPFVVNLENEAEVEVLGTHFNINAYDNEEAIRTTLLEGSVRVRSGMRQAVIRPGEQAQMRRNALDAIAVKTADPEKVMAWKNGFFNFENASLEEILRQLERWYDIEVVYSGKIPQKVFWGQMGMDLKLDDVLQFLERSNVKFTYQKERKLIVNP